MSIISENLKSMFENLENYVSSKTVVGEPTQIGDVVIIPLVDVSFGMVSGMSNSSDEKKGKDGGGGGVGAKISPTAMLVIMNGTVQLVNVKSQDSFNKVLDMVPGVLSKLSQVLGKKEAEVEEMDIDDLLNYGSASKDDASADRATS